MDGFVGVFMVFRFFAVLVLMDSSFSLALRFFSGMAAVKAVVNK